MKSVPFLPFHHWFERIVQSNPNELALICNEETMTYAELNQKANQLAHFLIEKGVTGNQLVGLLFERSFEMIISVLAIFKAGAAYVPLDPEYPASRLHYILEDTKLKYLLTQEKLVNLLPGSTPQFIVADRVWDQIESLSADNLVHVNISPDDLAYVMYTSGTTGQPKGVMIEHAGLANMTNEQARIFNIQPCDRVIQLSSICFDASIFEITMALRSGAKLCLIPDLNGRVGTSLFHFLKKYQITCMTIVPSVLNLLPIEDLPNLRMIISAGDVCTDELVQRWATGGRRFFNAYGPTETTVWATIEECRAGENPTIGFPIRNTVALILDEQGQEVPIGIEGELYLGGIQLARGYWNNPKITEERFISSLQKHKGTTRLYRTGDYAKRLPDGKLEFIGRAEHLLKIKGIRINPSEIEQAITKHPSIRQVCVTGWGNVAHFKKMVAYFSLHENEDVTALELKAFLKELLPHYMIPSQFIRVSEIPLTENGKVDWKQLPKTGASGGESDKLEPSDAYTEALLNLWRDVFELDGIDVDSHFFDDLGGDSLSAMDLLIRMEKIFQIELTLSFLFEAPTIEKMARSLAICKEDQAAVSQEPRRPEFNFDEEAVLDVDIVTRLKEYSGGQKILLTGSTGFLGSFLLRELLDSTDAVICCLVRANSIEEGKRRIEETFKKYKIPLCNMEERVEIILGNICKPMLGLDPLTYAHLAGSLDSIYHCASQVNFVYPYDHLKTANVEGTKEIIRLSSNGKLKTLHYISTMAVYGAVGYFGHPGIQEGELEHLDSLHMGYAESKAVADKLVMAAGGLGLPIYVYRLDDVIGHSKTGAWNTDDFICRYILGCIQLGVAPELDIQINAVPVDYMAKMIVHFSQKKSLAGKAFHLFNPSGMHQQELFGFFRRQGYDLSRVTYAAWQNILAAKVRQQKDHALYPLLPLFTERNTKCQLTVPEMYEEERRPHFLDSNTRMGLEGSGIQIPELSDLLFHKYLTFFKEIGFLT